MGNRSGAFLFVGNMFLLCIFASSQFKNSVRF